MIVWDAKVAELVDAPDLGCLPRNAACANGFKGYPRNGAQDGRFVMGHDSA